MRIFVKVKANAKIEKVEKIDETHYKVSVKEPAQEGRANWGVTRALAKYFNVSPTQVEIVSGLTSRDKVVILS